MSAPAVLVLEDGTVYHGEGFGASGTAFGEAVFTTGMTGYQETLTDPSYRRQVVVATAPQIGNTGWVAGSGSADGAGYGVSDDESGAIWVAGFVVRDLAPRPSNWRATSSLPDEMARQGIVGIAGVDTRAITRRLRTAGAMRVAASSAELTISPSMSRIRPRSAAPSMAPAIITISKPPNSASSR